MADNSQSISAQVASEEALEALVRIGRWCAEESLLQCLRFGDRPERYSDAAVIRRARKDVAVDFALDHELGFSHTPEEAQRYHDLYTTAFLFAWRDKSLLADLRKRLREGPHLIVCAR